MKTMDFYKDKEASQKKPIVPCCKWIYTVEPAQRIQYFGIIVSLCFGLQAICHIFSILMAIYVDDLLNLVIWSVAYHCFNVVSLLAVLIMFIPALSSIKQHKPLGCDPKKEKKQLPDSLKVSV